jgi:hypothetical protein
VLHSKQFRAELNCQDLANWFAAGATNTTAPYHLGLKSGDDSSHLKFQPKAEFMFLDSEMHNYF